MTASLPVAASYASCTEKRPAGESTVRSIDPCTFWSSARIRVRSAVKPVSGPGPGMPTVGTQILEGTSVRPGHADVEPHDVRAGSEHRGLPLGLKRRRGGERGEPGAEERGHARRNGAHAQGILTRCAFPGSPNMVHNFAA